MPERIQRQRTKGWRMPANSVYVGRPTQWGNPYEKRADAAEAYRKWITSDLFDARNLRELVQKYLKGKNLACWCPMDTDCHADVLLEIANA